MTKPLRFIVNNNEVATALPSGTTTLDFIRRQRILPGTKEGCREGECGACTILLGEPKNNRMEYRTAASCLLPLGELHGKHIVTIEGINSINLTPVQQTLVDEGASQCGFCTPGFVLALTGFFLTSPNLSFTDAIDAMDGNICRCTGYVALRRAAQKLCDTFAPKLEPNTDRIRQLTQWTILPDYFNHIPQRLQKLLAMPEADLGDIADDRLPINVKPPVETVIVAGGTDLFIQRPEELAHCDLHFISHRPNFSFIRRENEQVIIGAGTPTEDFKHSPIIQQLFPNINRYLNLVSSTLMRNRATAAGNIINASPIGDMSIMLLALDTSIVLANNDKKRTIPLRKFFKGYKQMDRQPGEILETIFFPVPEPDRRFHYEKVSRRKYLDIASVNSAVSIRSDGNTIFDIRLSAGGVSPIPLFLEKACAYLNGKALTAESIRAGAEIMAGEISPISDIRGSAQYKKLLLRNLFYGHFITLFPEKKFDEVLL